MLFRSRLFFALVAGVVIILISLGIAYVSFNILESSAEASLNEWKLSGAFSGFVFTASLLTSIVFQFYKQMTSDSIDSYKAIINELQTKLIKGAPCPEDFTIDIDERHKLVFARPNSWSPKGGILYQYVEPQKENDLIPANFNVTYITFSVLQAMMSKPINPGNIQLEELYESTKDTAISMLLHVPGYEEVSITQEYMNIDGLKSLKLVHTYKLPVILKENAEEKIDVCQMVLLTYVPKRQAIYQCTFSDNAAEYLSSSEIFNHIAVSIRFL